MDPITQTAASGLTQIQQFGIAGIMLSLLLCGGVFAIWYFARHCEKRTDEAIEAYKEEAKLNRSAIDKNTEAFHNLSLTLTRMDAKLER